MNEIAAAGFTRVSNACDGSTYTAAYNQQLLSLAAAAGLDAVVTDARGLQAAAGVNVSANLDALVADYAPFPALAGYHVQDEPGAAAFPALAAVVAGLRTRDPAHFTSINLFPDYASAAQLGTATYDQHVSSFLDTVQPAFFTYDHYNFLDGGVDGATFFQNLAVVRAHALARGIPWGQYIQSISFNGHRSTTGPEKRWAALHTLAYGGTGVFYFTYWTPPQTAENFGDGIITAAGTPGSQYADVTSINRTVAAMAPYLSAATSTRVFHSGALALGAVTRAPGDVVYVPSAAPLTVGIFAIGDGAYALLVNRDYAAITETDVVFAARDGRVDLLDVDQGAFLPASVTTDPLGARLHVTLPPGDGVLAHLPGPLPPGPVGAEAVFGTVRADAGWLDVVDARLGTFRLGMAGWGNCPESMTEVGRDFQSNGFWLCAPAALSARTYHVGNVVNDVGTLYRVAAGTTTTLGPGGWDTCPAGSLVGHRFESNGFWVCME